MDKSAVIKVLEFLRIVDEHDGKLSLSNLAVLFVIGRLVFTPVISIADIGVLLVTLLNYSAKKIINKDADVPKVSESMQALEALTSKVNDLESQVSSVSLAQGLKKR